MARYSVKGRMIREIRLSKGIGSKDLAKMAGIAEGTLLAIEEGKRQATEETLFSVAKALGVKADEILADDVQAQAPAPTKQVSGDKKAGA
jgi:transcriptional regulator with XRE-family HTH domain